MLHKVAAAIVAAAMVSWPAPPPSPAVVPVTNDYFGQKIVDPYQYFEHLDDPTVQTFFRQQADYTNAVLDRLGPPRERLRQDITRLAQSGPAIYNIMVVGDKLFYLERPPRANNARLMVREHGQSRVLLDPDALAKATESKAHLSISNVLPAPDGAHVAVGIVPGGAEVQTHTRIIDVASGKLSSEDFPRTWFGATAWT